MRLTNGIQWIYLMMLMVLLHVTGGVEIKADRKDISQSMSYADYREIFESEKNIVFERARTHAYVDVVPVGGGGGYMHLFFGDGVNDGNLTQSGDISTGAGGLGGFMVNLTPQWAVGGLFGGFSGQSADKIGGSFHDYGIWGSLYQFVVTHRPVISDQWLVDVDLGIGIVTGGYSNWVSTESSVSINTYRTGASLSGLMGVGVRYRFNSMWHLGVKTGYLFAQLSDLERGGVADGGDLDLSAGYVAVMMGGNF